MRQEAKEVSSDETRKPLGAMLRSLASALRRLGSEDTVRLAAERSLIG